MSLIQIDVSEKIINDKLDIFLAEGWFRSSFMMYKSPILCLNNSVSSIINIRLDINHYSPKKKHRKLLRRNAKKYRVHISDVQLSQQAENLYELSKVKFKGFIHPNLEGYLFAGQSSTPFKTKQIEVWHENKLVAISFFDLGNNSVASILGLYDPEYSKDSLGTYTMLLELEYSQTQGLSWYYPGYLVDNDSSFSYKLTLGDFQMMNHIGEWADQDKIVKEEYLGNIYNKKIEILRQSIENKLNSKISIYSYPHFSIGHFSPYSEDDFFDKPLFVLIEKKINYQLKLIASVDPKDNLYTLEMVYEESRPDNLMSTEISNDYKNNDLCFTNLIRTHVLIKSNNVTDVIKEIKVK